MSWTSAFRPDQDVKVFMLDEGDWIPGVVTHVHVDQDIVEVKLRTGRRVMVPKEWNDANRIAPTLTAPDPKPEELPDFTVPGAHVESGPQEPGMSPYAGTTELPPKAGNRVEDRRRRSEMAGGGMLSGQRVRVHHPNAYRYESSTGEVIDHGSTPAPYLVMRLDDGKKRIIPFSAINRVDEEE